MKDNFSRQSDGYARFRPSYPAELFDFIIQHVPEKRKAWDCATGNGQAAKELSLFFETVMATDISAKQTGNAYTAPNIFYSVQPAEETNFPAGSFDLVTIAQALHWFQFDRFYAEVRRTGRPGGIIAAWAYSLFSISPDIDRLMRQYHFEKLASYWDKERKYVDEGYATVPFPFEEIAVPAFSISCYWALEELEGYLNTWSALQKFVTAHGHNPVNELMGQIREYWSGERMKANFPIHLRLGKIGK